MRAFASYARKCAHSHHMRGMRAFASHARKCAHSHRMRRNASICAHSHRMRGNARICIACAEMPAFARIRIACAGMRAYARIRIACAGMRVYAEMSAQVQSPWLSNDVTLCVFCDATMMIPRCNVMRPTLLCVCFVVVKYQTLCLYHSGSIRWPFGNHKMVTRSVR